MNLVAGVGVKLHNLSAGNLLRGTSNMTPTPGIQ